MAIARCDKHTPTGIKHDYRAYALPIGYPETAAICGKMDCEEPARVWLTKADHAAFKRGIRVFNIRTHGKIARIRSSKFKLMGWMGAPGDRRKVDGASPSR